MIMLFFQRAVSKPDVFDTNPWISETGHFHLNMVLETDIQGASVNRAILKTSWRVDYLVFNTYGNNVYIK